MYELGALEVVPVLRWFSTAAMTNAATAITTATAATAPQIAPLDDDDALAGGADAGGADGEGGGAEGRTDRAEPPLGREYTTGTSGAASGETTGAALFVRYWASSIA